MITTLRLHTSPSLTLAQVLAMPMHERCVKVTKTTAASLGLEAIDGPDSLQFVGTQQEREARMVTLRAMSVSQSRQSRPNRWC